MAPGSEREASLKDRATFDFHGISIREMSPESLRSASSALLTVPPGAAHPTARSTLSDKIYVCLEGSALFDVAGVSHEIHRFDHLVVNQGEWFSYRNSGDGPTTLLLTHIPPFSMEHEEIAE
jgi:mannose-6-phosphate isomerase-like protein (cupin superfamily)